MSSLKGKRFIVTGGSKGIGRATAEMLARRGAHVVITARRQARVECTAQEIGAVAITADVGREDDAVRSVREAAEVLGGLDGLINNAGIGASMPLEHLDVGVFQHVLAVNVIGPAVMAREVIPHLRRSGGGDIVNVSSTSGLKGDAESSIYSASKFALRSMTQCWQGELRKEDIRVTLVNPSYVQTGFGKDESPAELKPCFLHPEDIASAIVACLELEPRALVPEVTVFATNPWAQAK